MSYCVVGNIIAQRIADGTLKKVPLTEYDNRNYINLFAVAKELNAPHVARIKEIFSWLDDKSLPQPSLAKDLQPLLQHKAPGVLDEDAKRQEKVLYIMAYNSFYQVVYSLADII